MKKTKVSLICLSFFAIISTLIAINIANSKYYTSEEKGFFLHIGPEPETPIDPEEPPLENSYNVFFHSFDAAGNDYIIDSLTQSFSEEEVSSTEEGIGEIEFPNQPENERTDFIGWSLRGIAAITENVNSTSPKYNTLNNLYKTTSSSIVKEKYSKFKAVKAADKVNELHFYDMYSNITFNVERKETTNSTGVGCYFSFGGYVNADDRFEVPPASGSTEPPTSDVDSYKTNSSVKLSSLSTSGYAAHFYVHPGTTINFRPEVSNQSENITVWEKTNGSFTKIHEVAKGTTNPTPYEYKTKISSKTFYIDTYKVVNIHYFDNDPNNISIYKTDTLNLRNDSFNIAYGAPTNYTGTFICWSRTGIYKGTPNDSASDRLPNKCYVQGETNVDVANLTSGGNLALLPIDTSYVITIVMSEGGDLESVKSLLVDPFREIDIKTEINGQNYSLNSSSVDWQHSGEASFYGSSALKFKLDADTMIGGTSGWRGSEYSADFQEWKYAKSGNDLYHLRAGRSTLHIYVHRYTKNNDPSFTPTIPEEEIVSGGGETSDSCLLAGTQILMSDGTTKAIENIKIGDKITVFDHTKGKYSVSDVIYTLRINGTVDIANLHFANGESLSVVNQGHSLFDATLNKYVLVSPQNVSTFVGHKFIYTKIVNGVKISDTTALINYDLSKKRIDRYDINTAIEMNHLANGFLACSDTLVGINNTFEFDRGLKYDKLLMLRDIEKYGLYEYSEWKDFVSEEEFKMFRGAFLKVTIGKKLTTFDELLSIVNDFNTYTNG